MRYLAVAFLVICLPLSRTQSKERICPLKGPQFPAPTGLASEVIFQNATGVIEQFIEANLEESPYNETTFSIGMFSTTDDELLYEFHHTDPTVKTSGLGANKVDANSIYRIASITKILTVYQWLIADGDQRFNNPISDFIPQLLEYQKQQDYYPGPRWDEITVNDLAMYLAGIARDCETHRCTWAGSSTTDFLSDGLNDVAVSGLITSLLPAMAAAVLPNNPANGIDVPMSDDPACGYFTADVEYLPCSREGNLPSSSR